MNYRSELKVIPIVLLAMMQVLGSAAVGRSGVYDRPTPYSLRNI